MTRNSKYTIETELKPKNADLKPTKGTIKIDSDINGYAHHSGVQNESQQNMDKNERTSENQTVENGINHMNETNRLILENVSYTVKVWPGRWYQCGCIRKKVEKKVLKNINAVCTQGKITALLGNSG